jgi:dihydroorotase
MDILIRQAKIISEGSVFNDKKLDILIKDGTIKQIGKSVTTKGKVKIIEAEGLHVSAGWIDMQVVSCDPGFEHKEDLDTMINCAASGGFTGVCVHNYNRPALHNKSQIEYIRNKTRDKIVDVIPFGTITVEGNSNDISEMYDMKLSGAAGFSDYKHSISDSGTVLRALQYSENIGSFIITHCKDECIARNGQMNEGEMAVTLGLKGIPALAESLMVQRNISVLEYAGGRLHIPLVSTTESVEMIKKAKGKGLKVTCGVAVMNLYADDSLLNDFDTNYKLDPPLRSKKEMLALRSALLKGHIDVLVSDHLPQDTESKDLEFDLADSGIISLQTAFSCAIEALEEKNVPAIVRSFTSNPRAILGLPEVFVKEGVKANLTLFSPTQHNTFSVTSNRSKSKNSPFIDRTLKGKVVGVINGNLSYFN